MALPLATEFIFDYMSMWMGKNIFEHSFRKGRSKIPGYPLTLGSVNFGSTTYIFLRTVPVCQVTGLIWYVLLHPTHTTLQRKYNYPHFTVRNEDLRDVYCLAKHYLVRKW